MSIETGWDIFGEAERFLMRMSEEGINPFSQGTIMEPWVADFVDVETIHGHATREIAALITQLRREGRSKARLLIGDTANGKSHVLARVKNRFADRCFFCFVEPLTGDGAAIFQHILANVVRDLFRAVPGSDHPQFHRVWRDFFLGAARSKTEHEKNFRAWTENRKHDFICLIENQLRTAGKILDPALIGVFYEYVKGYRANARLRLAVERWLRAGRLNEEEMGLVDFPPRSSIDTEDKAKEVIKSLGIITSFSKPILLCFDQVEAYLLNEPAFLAFMKAVEYLSEYTMNYAIVTAALLSFDEKLRTSGLTPSTWDRFNCGKRPIVIHSLTPEEGLKLIEARLAREMGHLPLLAQRPLFPFCSGDLDEILTPSGALRRTNKQARYVLLDAQSVFEEILAARPSALDIQRWFTGDTPLRGLPTPDQRAERWPRKGDVHRFLTTTLEETYAAYREDSAAVGIDEQRNRQIVTDLFFRVINQGGESRFLEVTDLRVFPQSASRACDFTVSVRRDDQQVHVVGVLFCDDPRGTVIKSRLRKASELLEKKAVSQVIYVRDERAGLTKKSTAMVRTFQEQYQQDPPLFMIVNALPRNLQHLKAMKRLFELAGSGDLRMYNPKLKRDYRPTDDDITDYLIANNCLLVNGLILTIVSGHDRCGRG